MSTSTTLSGTDIHIYLSIYLYVLLLETTVLHFLLYMQVHVLAAHLLPTHLPLALSAYCSYEIDPFRQPPSMSDVDIGEPTVLSAHTHMRPTSLETQLVDDLRE